MHSCKEDKTELWDPSAIFNFEILMRLDYVKLAVQYHKRLRLYGNQMTKFRIPNNLIGFNKDFVLRTVKSFSIKIF